MVAPPLYDTHVLIMAWDPPAGQGEVDVEVADIVPALSGILHPHRLPSRRASCCPCRRRTSL
jgi:hypothetical protein